MMKVIEEDAAVVRETKKLKATKLLSRVKEGIINEKDYSIDLERQLKKLATRGGKLLYVKCLNYTSNFFVCS